jgi:hypothetical protein
VASHVTKVLDRISEKDQCGNGQKSRGAAPEIVKCLAEKKIIASARGKGLRILVHIFNNFDDINLGLRELTSMARASTE